MSNLDVAIAGVSTKATFVGGTEDGKTRHVWATPEIVIAMQSPPAHTADEIKKWDLKTLMSKSASKPRRQIYALAYRGPDNTATYLLKRVEVPT